jgi:rhodanese-related sulfurtransferase
MNAFAQLAAVSTISFAAAGASWLLRSSPDTPPTFHCDASKIPSDEICLSDAKGKILWVDARSRSEWQETGIKDSILWNMDSQEDANTFEAEAAPHIAAAELVVVYCGSEKCGISREVADRIRRMDLGPQVKVLHGGWDAIKDSSLAP